MTQKDADIEKMGADNNTPDDLPAVTVRPEVYTTLMTNGRSSTCDNEGPSLWLITFTDIMALMLTFFVLLYSMSVPEEEKWEDISDSMVKGFSKFYSPEYYTGPQDAIAIEKLDMTEALNLNYLGTILQKVIDGDERLKNIAIIPQNDRLIISLPHDLLFDVGESEVGTEGKRALFALGGVLNRIRNRVEIVGHADPRPILEDSGPYTTNWGLSLARAAQVSNILNQVGYRRNVIVRGMSSARYDELPTAMDRDARLDLSRRVDIVIMEDDGSNRMFLEFGNAG